MTKFTKEQLIARIEKQIDINATIIERLGDDSAATSELAVKTATMDIKILDIALAALTAPVPNIDALAAEIVENLVDLGGADEVAESQYRGWVHKKLFAYAVAINNSKGRK